jgi:hypothetical protein
MNNFNNQELFSFYSQEELDLIGGDFSFFNDNKLMIDNFFGFNVTNLYPELLLLSKTGNYINKFRNLEVGQIALHVTEIPERSCIGVTVFKHRHYVKVLNIGGGFLAIKTIDPDPTHDIRTDKTISMRIDNNYIIDPFDHSLSPNKRNQPCFFEDQID